MTKKYDSSAIKKLEFPENVQQRVTMYIGNVGVEGVMHLIRELIDNSLDEFINGFAKNIEVIVDTSKNEITVKDDGRGIPVDNNVLQEIFCNLHSGGKFDKGSYSMSAGLNGVGVSCVNALSEYTIVEVHKDGYIWTQEFRAGYVHTKLKKGKKTNKTGTSITFKPHKEYLMLKDIDEILDVEELKQQIQRHAYLNKGLKIVLYDVVANKKYEYSYKNGIIDYIKALNTKPLFKDIFYVNTRDEETNIHVEIAIGYSKTHEENVQTFCNGIFTSEGGTHLTGFRIGISNNVSKYVEENNLIPKRSDLTIKGEDTREGLIAVVSIKHPNPLFKGQNKQNLSNTDAQGVVQRVINSEFSEFLNSNPSIGKAIGTKAVMAARGRQAAQSARNRTLQSSGDTAFASINSVSKLADCVLKDNEKTELFLVEGDSAGGSSKDGRDREFQAIYCLKGKPLNTNDVDLNIILDPKSRRYNKEISDLVNIIGCGVGDAYDDKKRKYGKVIIMCDADVDGNHIQSLLLTFFFRHMSQLIENERLYIAMSPLYRVREGGKFVYLLDDIEYENYIHKKIIDKFNVGVLNDKGDDVNLFTKAQFKKVLTSTKNYLEDLRNVASIIGISPTLTERLIEFGNKDFNEMKKLLKTIGLDCRKVKGTNSIEVDGFFEGEYYSFFIDSNFRDLVKPLEEFLDKNRQYRTLYLEEEDAYMPYSLGELLDLLYTKSTPKDRTRLKGLGESDPEELWETTMNPKTRRIIKVTMNDVEKTSDIVEILMGKKAELRRDFLEENLHFVGELDI